MGWQDIVTALQGGQPAVDEDNPLLAQQANITRQQAIVDELKKRAAPAAMGTMVGGRYIPNFGGLAQQAIGAVQGQMAQDSLQSMQLAAQKAQQAAAQQSLLGKPEAPGDQSQGPPIPGQMQDQMQGKFGTELLANPLTAKEGQKILEKALGGGFSQAMQERSDKLAAAEESRQLRLAMQQNTFENQKAIQRMREEGLTNRNAAKNAGGAMLTPNQAFQANQKLETDIGKAVKPYADTMDAMDKVNALINGGPITPAVSDALAYAFNKFSDPNSVVMPSEYARIKEMNDLITKAKLKLKSVFDGTVTMDDKLARDLQQTMDRVGGMTREKVYSITDQKAKFGRKYKLDPNDYTRPAWRRPGNKDYESEDQLPADFGEETPSSGGNQKSPATGGGAGVATGQVQTLPSQDGMVTLRPGGKPMPVDHKDPAYDEAEKRLFPQYADDLRALRVGGERSNADKVSTSGASTPYQLIPGNIKANIEKDGFDPLSSVDNAVRGAAKVWAWALKTANGDKKKAVELYRGAQDKAYQGRVAGVLNKTAAAQADSVKPTQSVLTQKGWNAGGVTIEKVE